MKKDLEYPPDIEAVLNLHLGKDFRELDVETCLAGLSKKRSRYWIMIAVNAFALIFFSYSFIYEITQFSDVVYYALGTVFVLNVLLIVYQRKQISKAIEFLDQNR
ncbi:MAG: hypothetical protein LAT57_01525 [Balneolales bacterium]|nr:hypothetical protein [Balneolales bacterium]